MPLSKQLFPIWQDKAELCYIWTPLVFLGVVSFLIAHTFFCVYEVSIVHLPEQW